MTPRRALTAVAGLAACAALAPASAEAHLVVTGLGPVYDGITHFGLSPEDLLPVAALGLYAGLRGAAQARWSLAGLALSWLGGGLLAMAGAVAPAIALSVSTAGLFLLVGAVLALNRDFGLRWCVALAALLGLVRGLADLAGASLTPAHALTLFGMTASAFVLFALAASLTLPMRQLWMIVTARVGGSWLAALGLLLAGWVLRYGAQIQ